MDADGLSLMSTKELENLTSVLEAKKKTDLAARRKKKQADQTWKARNLAHGGNRHERRSRMTQTRLGMKHDFRKWQHDRKVKAASNARKASQ